MSVNKEQAQVNDELMVEDTPKDILADNKVLTADKYMITNNTAYHPYLMPTGFKEFDVYLRGGLPKGLTIIGAMSSFGKSTLCSQIADYYAMQGQSVLYVNMEMSAKVIIARSQSRWLKLKFNKEHNSSKIINKDNWDLLFINDLDMVNEWYQKEIAPNLYYWDSIHPQTTKQIRDIVLEIESRKGLPPIVVVDYLQLLGSDSHAISDKARLDDNITELRSLAREIDMPVLLISSFNRASYGGGVGMSSFSGSAGIEYSADLLIGIEPRGITQKVKGWKKDTTITKEQMSYKIIDEYDRCMDNVICDVELKVLKMRDNEKPKSELPLRFNKALSTFEPIDNKVNNNRFEEVKDVC